MLPVRQIGSTKTRTSLRSKMSKTERLRLPENDETFGGNKIFDLFQYSPAVSANGLVFIAGQVGLRADGTIPVSAEEQIDLAFKRAEVILRNFDLDFTDLVELVSYHVDVASQLGDFRAAKERYIRSDFPAWTILGVASLARPELLIEIKMVAALRK
jgi:enamine deaminase RidA (YjgF/YER057c/UK114 family)